MSTRKAGLRLRHAAKPIFGQFFYHPEEKDKRPGKWTVLTSLRALTTITGYPWCFATVPGNLTYLTTVAADPIWQGEDLDATVARDFINGWIVPRGGIPLGGANIDAVIGDNLFTCSGGIARNEGSQGRLQNVAIPCGVQPGGGPANVMVFSARVDAAHDDWQTDARKALVMEGDPPGSNESKPARWLQEVQKNHSETAVLINLAILAYRYYLDPTNAVDLKQRKPKHTCVFLFEEMLLTLAGGRQMTDTESDKAVSSDLKLEEVLGLFKDQLKQAGRTIYANKAIS